MTSKLIIITYYYTVYIVFVAIAPGLSPPRKPPVCAVKCTTTENPICGGPINGCGLLMSFRNPCYMTSYNCQHNLNRNYYLEISFTYKMYEVYKYCCWNCLVQKNYNKMIGTKIHFIYFAVRYRVVTDFG